MMSCTWAACSATATTFTHQPLPTGTCQRQRGPHDRLGSALIPSAVPLSICTHCCHFVGDLPITADHEGGSLRERSWLPEVEEAFQALVLPGADLLQLDHLARSV